jgi:cellulose synthase/poly-beta-1,6-N-acetylglucosamine synthase-like glycosyltransferase
MSLPFVSVVVASLDTDGLHECLASLSATNYAPPRREILVVGADPAGRTQRIAETHSATYVRGDAKSVTAARNRGIAESRGEIVAFTDPDCVVSHTWLRELVKPFADREVGAVAGAILPYPPRTPAERYMARRRSHSQERPMTYTPRPFAMTPNLAFRRDVFDGIGVFDTRFPGGGWEDADLCWRFNERLTRRLVYAPRAAVFHRYRATTSAFVVQQYRYGYGLGVLTKKYRRALPDEWRARAGSAAELASSLSSLAVAAMRTVRQRENEELSACCFDVLRLLGQRSGYWVASLMSQ